ncbi:MAG: bifunctional UDP-N-acetylglucosamine diphosphorylase/glucosamine-1-phosphate N-acetyltransferase GlmU [Dehalococcoidia bacterium]
MTKASHNWIAVVLAAGVGQRMRSRRPKVLHPLAGKPLVCHVVDAARRARVERCVAVVGPGEEAVRVALGNGVGYARQAEPLGTGHALAQAEPLASDAEHLLILHGDVPLLTPETLSRLMRSHLEHDADLTMLTACVDEAGGYGEVRRDDRNRVVEVVEAADRDRSSAGRAEINGGIYCFRAAWVWPRLGAIPRAHNGEHYLTELVGMAVREGATVVAVQADDADEVRGINDRVQLAEAERVMRERIRRRHLLAGVTMVDPASTYIEADVTVGQDTVIHPNTTLAGGTVVGAECEIGPNSIVRDSSLGARCRIVASVVAGATLEEEVEVGPYSHLRPGSYLCRGVHVGNLAEVKNARLGPNTKMGHFSYIGDAEVGADVNIGAGTITCNFDGVRKQRTVIGDGAFIGSDTMLVAPVTVGRGARTGAGSVVNRDVPAGSTAVGAPARVRRNRAARRGEREVSS